MSRLFHALAISLIEQTHRSDALSRASQAQFYKVTVGVETNPGRLRPSTFRESTLFRVLKSKVTSWYKAIYKLSIFTTVCIIVDSSSIAPVFAKDDYLQTSQASLHQVTEELKGELRAKDFYKAEKIARKMLASWPDEARSYDAMGEVKKGQRIYSESLKYFNQALTKKGDRCEVLIDRADLYKLMDEDALVLADCRLALKCADIRASQCSHLAQLLAAIDSPLDSITACDKGLSLKADNFNLMRLKATNLSSLKRFAEAETTLLKALAQKPDDEKALRELGFVRSYMKKYSDAISSFDALLKRGTEREVRQMEVLQERASCQFALGHYEKCVADLSACIKMYPLNRHLYSQRAEAYLKMGDRAKAQADRAKMGEFDHSFKPL